MNKKINKLVNQLHIIKDKLTQEILNEMGKVAIKDNIDEMNFLMVTTLKSKGSEVDNKEIEALENIYLDEICDSGFQELWTKDKGWL